MPENEVLLQCQGLVKEFRTRSGVVHAVSGVDLTLYKGETLALVGESGCGKSTLGRLILGLIKATAGRIEYKDMDLTSLSSKEYRKIRSNIQCIFQDPYGSLDPRISVSNTIQEPLKINKRGSRAEQELRVEELLKTVGIPVEYKNRFPHQFSGGQRQRICIARALALNPELIICDEPVSALDVSIQAQVLNLLADLQEELGLTYLFISHDLNVVRRISNRVYIMYLGKVCESGETESIFSHPMHPYTRFLLSAVPVTDPSDRSESKEIISGDLPSPITPPKGCRFHTRCPYATAECREKEPEARMIDGHQVFCHHPL
ncbi:MAG: oligopeptide/dipeptide ABC transporter ATP-binding protein [Candidatus Ornithospirochaeta sp.]|nr:oligopeptide/dipeptide ABC transporter ATP-binding protein [Candidatus Ornithospirochaeta sp.]